MADDRVYSAPPRGLLAAIHLPSLAAVNFSLRTVAASSLALAAALVLQLDSPFWAPVTVWIVANPHPANVWGRGFFRIVGTLAGAAASVGLFALFSQAPVAFLCALAVWLGVCTMVSIRLKNFHAYAAVLAGYTSAIVASYALEEPERIFTLAVARVTCVTLGVAAVAVISSICHHDILAPSEPPAAKSPPVPRPGWRDSVIGGLRGMIAVGVAGLLWIAFAFPSGIYVLLNAAVFCSLFSTHPAPHHASMQFGLCIFLSGLLAFFFRHFLFPQMDTLPLLLASLAIVLFPGGIAMAFPRTAFAAAGFVINFMNQLQITNSMSYDPAGFINVMTASVVGSVITALAFLTIFPRIAFTKSHA